ncbi:unnamed protein product, partial [Staurois parvus]
MTRDCGHSTGDDQRPFSNAHISRGVLLARSPGENRGKKPKK